MRYGVVLPMLGLNETIELAATAETSGWDGLFIPDCINISPAFNNGVPYETWDPWVLMAAMAVRTERVRLGTMITALSRRRPWKVARETVTLDHLSNGRLVLPVGLGALDDEGFGKVGEATDRKIRAELMDESLDIISGLWSGEPLTYQGKHYQVDGMTFAPRPIQQPRIPVWVVGAWPRERSMRRVARWDGICPNKLNPDGSQGTLTHEDVREMAAWVAARRDAGTPFDIVIEGTTAADDKAAGAATVNEWASAGATWWIESFWTTSDPRAIRARIEAGPPRVE